MIVEYVRYDLPPDRRAAFEAAYGRAGGLLEASPHCLGWEFRRGIEDPGQYVIRIEWDSVDGHMRGFRESEPFQVFYKELSAFADFRLQMSHFERV
jgi:heme-degrading monooxygenase HmoA